MALRDSGRMSWEVDVWKSAREVLPLLHGTVVPGMGTREALLRRSRTLINLFVIRD